MSFTVSKVENSPTFSKANYEFLEKWMAWIAPTEKLISSLPSELKSQIVRPVLFQRDSSEFLDMILNFDVHPDDVYVDSIPKCGSTWMTTVVWLLTHNLDYQAIQADGREKLMGDFDLVYHPIAVKKKVDEMLANSDTNTLSVTEARQMAWDEMFGCLKAPRVIKVHYPPYFLPKGIWSKGARIIYVARNPKDTAVSYYHFIRNYFQANITMDDAVNGVINDMSIMSPHLEHIQNFWKIKHLPNVLFVHYESLVNDSFATLKTMSDFLGQSYSDEQLKELAEFISFKKMRNNNSINREDDMVRMETLYGNKRPDADFR